MRHLRNIVLFISLIAWSSCATTTPKVLYLSDPIIHQMFTMSLVSYNRIENVAGKSELHIQFKLRLNRPESVQLETELAKFLKSTVLYDANKREIKDLQIGTKIVNFVTSAVYNKKRLERIYPVILIIPSDIKVKYVKWHEFPLLELK